jgi:hypothetical protein
VDGIRFLFKSFSELAALAFKLQKISTMKFLSGSVFVFYLLLVSYSSTARKKSFEEWRRAAKADSTMVQLIDEDKLRTIVQSGTAELYLVSIYSNHCIGTRYLLRDADTLEQKYADRLKIMLCSSSPMSEFDEMMKSMITYHIDTKPIYMIDDRRYPEKRFDSRFKGIRFRDAICKPCKGIIIGVPFNILFDSKGNVIQYGYPSKFDYIKFIHEYLK